uniref:Uncharacterized protein n=1 Tax=viral metagenome TaxID=1070528 RepID=A0A6C0KCM2_9ZZZZ|tara:strand:+ start:187 stop:426 length:240 start_codon:yes stop_codon:yes gene_type:complete
MNFKRLIYSDVGRIVISVLLGLGLATLFRRVCKERDCLVFHAPEMNKIKGQVFKFKNKCYQFEEEIEKCDSRKKIVEFA